MEQNKQDGISQRTLYGNWMYVSLIDKEVTSGFMNASVLQKWRCVSNILSLMLFSGGEISYDFLPEDDILWGLTQVLCSKDALES